MRTTLHTLTLAALGVALVTLVAPTRAEAKDDLALILGGSADLGWVDFNALPDTERGWGFTLRGGVGYGGDGLVFGTSLVYAYMRTADGSGANRVVTSADFAGVVAEVLLIEGDSWGVEVFAGPGFIRRHVDAVPNGEVDSTTDDSGFGFTLGSLVGVGLDGVGVAGLGLSYTHQSQNVGLSYVTLSLGITAGGGF